MSGLETTMSVSSSDIENMQEMQTHQEKSSLLSPQEYYAATAFSSRDIPDLEAAVYEKDSQQWPSLSLPWERRPDSAKIRRAIAFGPEGAAPEKSQNMTCTERFLQFVMPSTKFHPLFCIVAQLFCAYLAGVGIYFWAGGQYIEVVWGISLVFFAIVLVCLFLRFNIVLTFDRRTGTLTEGLYGGSCAVNVIFYECDPYVVAIRKNEKEPIRYQLGFRPRLLPSLREPWIAYESAEKEDIYVMWHFIQMFMDSSRPLPDIPALELYRSLDPRTVLYDRRHRREAEYWAWKAPEERIMTYTKALQRFPEVEPVWPCLVARHIQGRNPEESIHVRPN